ncbi:T9SS type A sorting domain-containing protein [Psychroflexus planctonicus]|uniref:Secretion system C-terminal sorting domain-containing protein n=1 Tax=Psychroflexus planctonicus TaxID=1526575 RepID=A0ABQ1SLB6_9FLAO|nr:T9SS type A sorting domain-containing protein [Psychroflexus planctonicus]GGE42388.1 hypothetical protein GCM10010832_22940 [Psychroflexus planctonicus]
MQKFYVSLLILFSFLASHSQDMFIAGSAIPSWWTNPDPIPNISLIDNGDGTYYKLGLELLDGNLRFYEEQDIDINYGGTAFPSGELAESDIIIEEGFYDLYVDMNTNTYYFESYPQVSFNTFNTSNPIGFKLNTTDYEVFNYPVTQFYDALGWFSVNIHPYIMENDIYGGDIFPSGNLIFNTQPVEVESGFYEVTFDHENLTFSFDIPEISIVGSALNETSTDENSTPEIAMSSSNGAIYMLSSIELQPGELKFRQNQSWETNWGGSTFPTGDLDLDSADYIVVDEAGFYDVTFDRENSSYMFVTLSTENIEFSDLKVYPNPSKGNWNIQTGNADVKTLSVFTISGKLIKEMNVSQQNEIEINTANLGSGMYMLKILTNSGNTKTLKLIKQ